MDFLLKTISSKRSDLQKAKDKAFGVGFEKTTKKRFLRRSELEELENEKESAKKRKIEEHEEMISKAEKEKKMKEEENKKAKEKRIKEMQATPITEIKRRLREMKEPVTLFGESGFERFERLKKLELIWSERQHGTTGKSNLFKEMIEKEIAAEILAAAVENMENEKEGGERKENEMKKQERQKKQAKYASFKTRSEVSSDEEYCIHFIKRLMYLWEEDLRNRPDAEKRTPGGLHETTSHKETRHYLQPLLKNLKKQKCEADILELLVSIVNLCLKKDYKGAGENYMMLAIGDAAWPIGVTMVGIHERAGREKIFSQKVAHVLNDETQRKYIQGFKRLITYCSVKFP